MMIDWLTSATLTAARQPIFWPSALGVVQPGRLYLKLEYLPRVSVRLEYA
jgi:hypothetical protein